jgi:hypothetical protein
MQLDLPISDGLHDSISGHSFSRIYTWQVTVTRPKPDAVVLLAKAERRRPRTRGRENNKTRFFQKNCHYDKILRQDFTKKQYEKQYRKGSRVTVLGCSRREVRDKIRVRLQVEGGEQNLCMRVRCACLNGARMQSACRSPRITRVPRGGSARE